MKTNRNLDLYKLLLAFQVAQHLVQFPAITRTLAITKNPTWSLVVFSPVPPRPCQGIPVDQIWLCGCSVLMLACKVGDVKTQGHLSAGPLIHNHRQKNKLDPFFSVSKIHWFIYYAGTVYPLCSQNHTLWQHTEPHTLFTKLLLLNAIFNLT